MAEDKKDDGSGVVALLVLIISLMALCVAGMVGA